MLRLLGVTPIPTGTIAYATLAIVCLVVGFLINLIASVIAWPTLLWVSLPMLGVGALCAVLAVRKAATG